MSEPADAFRRYTQAFHSLDPQATAQYFHEPALMLLPDEVVALPDRAAVEQLYTRVMADLPALGYARTEFGPLAERRLSDDLVVIAGSGIWKNAAGQDLRRFGMTYTLRRTADAWRIVVAAIHDPDATR